jgi:hypothetical protein
MQILTGFVAGAHEPHPDGASGGPWWEYFGYGFLSSLILGVTLLTVVLLLRV